MDAHALAVLMQEVDADSAVIGRFDKQGDYHERLLRRRLLDLPGIRPGFVPPSAVRDLTEFRHVVWNACGFELREERVAELARLANRLATQLPALSADFASRVRSEQGW